MPYLKVGTGGDNNAVSSGSCADARTSRWNPYIFAAPQALQGIKPSAAVDLTRDVICFFIYA